MTKKPNSMRHLDDAIRRSCGDVFLGNVLRRGRILADDASREALPALAEAVVEPFHVEVGVHGRRHVQVCSEPRRRVAVAHLDRASALHHAVGEHLSDDGVGHARAQSHVILRSAMQPCEVKLSYLGKSWCTVPLEVGFNEIGDADTIEWSDMPDVAELFEGIGFPPPGKAPLMPLDHQVTQKLHAVSGAGDRARDLVDLQLIMHRSEVDLVATRRICERLFSYRKAQEWPPIVSKKAGWDELYAEQASDLPVLDDVDSAIDWVNDLIVRIGNAK